MTQKQADYIVNGVEHELTDHSYIVHLTAQDITFLAHGDCEQDALDAVIDFCEDRFPGLVSDQDEDGEYYCGGNSSLYLTTDHVRIEEIR